MISIRGKEWFAPADTASMSGLEQAYLIAGNLAAVYHQSKRPTASVHTQGQMLYVGAQPIADLSAEPNPAAVTARLQALL